MKPLKVLDLFSGIGGFALAARMVNQEVGSTVLDVRQFCELEPFCQRVLAKNFPGIPVWADIRDYHPFPGQFDLYTLGYPCQGNSRANISGQGLADPRSGLWFEALRCIHEGQPPFVVVENVPPTVNRNWLRTVLEGLDQAGFDAEWEIVTAAEVGAPHLRERLFIVAYADSRRQQRNSSKATSGRNEPLSSNQNPCELATHPDCDRLQRESQIQVEPGRAYARRIPDSPPPGDSMQQGRARSQDTHEGRTIAANGLETSPIANSVSVSQRQCQRGFQTDSGSGYQATESDSQPGSLGVDDGIPNWLDGVTYSGWWAENQPPVNAGVAPRSVPNRGQRIHACGNSVVPGAAAIALRRVLQLAKSKGVL